MRVFKDDNERHVAGVLPTDPFDGTRKLIPDESPSSPAGARSEAKKAAAAAGRTYQDLNPLELIMGKEGPKRLLANAMTVLDQPEWARVLVYDEMAARPMLLAESPAHAGLVSTYPRPWQDADDLHVTNYMQTRFQLFVTPNTVANAVDAVVMRRRVHAARDYLARLQWDGRARLDRWLVTYLGVEDSLYTRAVGSKFLIGGVARARKPGCKVDTTLILEGPQGKGKSQALAALLPNESLFTDDLGADLGKDAAERLPGKWIVEVAELDSFRRAETSRIKSFISRQVDHFRVSYGKRAGDYPRHCIFAGSTNAMTYLRDESGGRRFWPVAVVSIDLEGLRRDRDQLWAEAVVRYQAGECWWLDADQSAAARLEQEARREIDPWQEVVEQFLATRSEARNTEILDLLKIDIEKRDQGHSNRVARILQALQWVRKQRRVAGAADQREYVYVPLQTANGELPSFILSPVSPVE